MMVMWERNGVGVAVMLFPERKKPCLAYYDEEENCFTKLASFNNQHSAERFVEIMDSRFLKGLVKEKAEEVQEN